MTSVPIVVTSTTADYFVLYASHDVDGTAVEYPVQLALGEDGTTTLAENVAPLPAERYRVEKYSIADPADVDGDCIDDITELSNPVSMNPVNPGEATAITDGAVVVPDQATFETLALLGPSGISHLKFVIVNIDSDRPKVYFQNTNTFRHHRRFLDAIDTSLQDVVRGSIIYDPELVGPTGSHGVFRFTRTAVSGSLGLLERAFTLLAASMPVLEDNLAVWITNEALPTVQDDLALFWASRMDFVFDEDVYGDTDFLALNTGEGFGLLRSLEPDERPGSRDVVIYEALPNELPRVAGIISTVPQTPLSHVNLRALQDSVPNAFIADALEDDILRGLIDSYVYFAVSESGYSIRAASQAEVDEHFAASRPAELQTPQRDLSVTEIAALSEIGFDDWDAFGVKAANVAVLGTLGFPSRTVPDGFAVPFYFYDEFMKHNELYDYIEEMVADPDFQSDYDVKQNELKKLQKKIKKGTTPTWIDSALTEMHAVFAEGTSLRYRSSTNNEDLPGFNGAGLYDSKTQHPDETEEDGIAKSLKQVYASMWNYRAFIERDFHRVDHLSAAMGVLVHPNYSDELVNGVAVSADPAYGTEGSYYVNSQVGEDLVTNPEAHSVPEEVLLYPDGTYGVTAVSNQVPPGQLLMTDEQLGQLRWHLTAIHDRFAQLYAVSENEQFAMEIEFKITSDNVLAIKQARPWIFSDPAPDIDDTSRENTEATLTASLEFVPATHDGNNFRIRVRFSDYISIRRQEFRDQAVTVTGGRVTGANQVADWGQGQLWAIWITPDSPLEDVTLVLADGRPCTAPGAICTRNGKLLSNRVDFTVEGLLPRVPDRPTAVALSSNSVALEWNEVPRADSYEVEFLYAGRWAHLPASGAEIAFDGAEAVVSGLPTGGVYEFRVRAVNSYGTSEWSDQLLMTMQAVLESELTAGWQTDISPTVSGFWSYGGPGGTMSPDKFTLEGKTFEVKFLLHFSGGLWLGTSRELPADFTLHVGDSVYVGSESLVAHAVAGGSYWWPSAVPDWFGGDPVGVSLILHPGIELKDRAKALVTGYFSGFPAEHDSQADVSFRIYFSDGVDTTADAMRDQVLSVTGGEVSGVEAVDSEGRIWTIRVTPASRTDAVTVRIESGLDCDLPAVICAGDRRQLLNSMELTVLAKQWHPPTGTLTISGTVEVGQTLTADTSGIGDADGLTNANFNYQWIRNDGHIVTDIQGATDASYTLAESDLGKAFKVRVAFTDDAGWEETLTSALASSERPYGLTVTESDGAVELRWKLPVGWRWSNLVQIMRNRPELGETEPLVHIRYSNTFTTAFTDTDVEPEVLYEYRVKGVDPFGLTYDMSEPVEFRTTESTRADNSPATGAPAVIGVPQIGETLTASTSGIADQDGLHSAVFRYQWLADDSDIAGATGFRYALAETDENKAITVRVSFTDDAGWEETLSSAPTAAVTAGIPQLTGTLLDFPEIHDGQNAFTFELRFSEELNLSYVTLRDHAFSVTGGAVTRARRLAPPGNIRWEITILPESDADVSVVLPASQNCADRGAVCGDDGRMLSAETTLTVAGPNGTAAGTR